MYKAMTDQCTVPVSRKLSMIELRKNSSPQTCYASNSSSTNRAVFNLWQKYTTTLKVNLYTLDCDYNTLCEHVHSFVYLFSSTHTFLFFSDLQTNHLIYFALQKIKNENLFRHLRKWKKWQSIFLSWKKKVQSSCIIPVISASILYIYIFFNNWSYKFRLRDKN